MVTEAALSKAQKAVNARNKRFDNASPEEKRVIMAKHAILWMEGGGLIPTPGTYVRPVRDSISNIAETAEDSFVEVRDVVLGPCKACIKGALLLVKAELFDEVTLQALAEYSGDDLLDEEFGADNADSMERAFEQRADLEAVHGPMPWGVIYPDPAVRYKAILENVIRNNGTFKISEVWPP